MKLTCPQCGLSHIESKNTAKNTFGVIGTVGGGTTGVLKAIKGAKVGKQIGSITGPIGGAIGTVMGGIIGGVLGALTGGITGSQIGSVVDEYLLNNYVCLSCGHEFSLSADVVAEPYLINEPSFLENKEIEHPTEI